MNQFMAKKPAQIRVNLLPKDPFYETPVGKILKWSLSVGRYIVIFTELIVILSFVTRFSLDREVTDLNESIFLKQSRIEAFGDLEERIRETQKKIEQYNQIKQQSNIAEVFPKLSQITPTDIKLKDLVVKTDTIIMTGSSLSQNSLNLLITNIQLSPDFSNVVVDSIETGDKSDPGFHFTIRANTRVTTTTEATPEPEEKVNILDRTQGL
jgi:Tfp pilus assembly protein PilN